MPTRMLRNWTDSLKFDGISAEAERLFVRLIMVADDYGLYHAEPRLVKAGCFPLQDQIRPNDLVRWLDELSHRQLILRYDVRSRTYLAIINYGQRLKQSRAKFPPPPGDSIDFPEVPAESGKFPEVPGSSRKFPSESETETETYLTLPHTAPAREIPDWQSVLAFAAAIGLAEWRAADEFEKLESTGWVDGKGREIRKWKPYFTRVKSWWEADGRPSAPTRPGGSGKHAKSEAQRDAERTGFAPKPLKLRKL